MIKTKRKHIMAAAALICTAIISGCFGSEPPADTSAVTTADTESHISAGVLASEEEHTGEKSGLPLRIAVDSIDEQYTPFTGSGRFHDLMDKLTGVCIASETRSGRALMKGIAGDTENFLGTRYEYKGISDIYMYRNEKEGTVTCTVLLKEGVTFSDGRELDADDALFTLYVLLDPAYNGTSTLQDIGIVGAANYLFDSAYADDITEEEIEAAFGSEEMTDIIREKIVIPELERQYETILSYYDDSTYSVYTEAYPDPNSLFAFFFAPGMKYEYAQGRSSADVILAVADYYGGDFRMLAGMTVGDTEAFDREAHMQAVRYIMEKRAAEEAAENESRAYPEHINTVSGIKKTGSHGFSVTAKCSPAELADALTHVVIAPLHYYGNEAEYDPGNGKFGFEKGSADKVLSVHVGEPLGAGAYKFGNIENGTIRLEANEAFYKGSPFTDAIEISAADADMTGADIIAEGLADICFADGSAETYAEIDEANRSLEKVCAVVSSGYGYGYVGLNIDNVNVAGEPLSEKSIMLRKALCTAIAYFRQDSVYEYYGTHAETTDYPSDDGVRINTLAEDYTVPFSLKEDGEPIFTDGMEAADRRAAVKEACIGYLKAAGYKFSDDGIAVEAPEGGKLTFDAALVAGGTGKHPIYKAFTEASALLSEIGITLEVNDLAGAGDLWDMIKNSSQQIWAGAWNTGVGKRFSSGYYGSIPNDPDGIVSAAESAAPEDRDEAYMTCYDLIINGWAAEIPVYRRTGCTLISPLRVDMSGVPNNTTGSYGIADEIYRISMK